MAEKEKFERREYVIAAHPGFQLLTPITGDNDEITELWHEPIIAWRIVTESNEKRRSDGRELAFTDAITADGMDDGKADAAILRPDGKVVRPLDQAWGSEQEFLDGLREEKRKRLAAKRK